MHRLNPSLNDVLWSIEIGLADFQVDNVLALPLQSASALQHFKCSLRAQARHAASQAQLVLKGLRHSKV